MNKWESEQWRNHGDSRRVPERVQVIVEMTPEEYERIRKNASWDYNGSVADYLKWHALGGKRRGC